MNELKVMAVLVAMLVSGCVVTDGENRIGDESGLKSVEAGARANADEDKGVASLGEGVLSSYHPNRLTCATRIGL